MYGRYGFTSNAICYIKNVKLEKGNKATDWTPAPEDMETRMSSAEQKITASAILNSVNTQIGAGGQINTVSTVLDKNGFTVKNGAIKVQNNAGQTVLSGDSNGNLWVQNSLSVGGNTDGNIQLKNASNTTIFSASKNGLFLKDGVMKVTTGGINWGSIGSYPSGEKRDMDIRAYGLAIQETDATGSSQMYERRADYQGGHMQLIIDNSGNAIQTSWKNHHTGRYITNILEKPSYWKIYNTF